MTAHSLHTMARMMASTVALGLLLAGAGCGSEGTGSQGRQSEPSRTSRQNSDRVAIFTPSDGITISQHTPLNKWTKFVPKLVDDLKKEGLGNRSITQKTSPDLERQSSEVQDYVVKDLASVSSNAAHHTTIVIAPAVSDNESSRQFGDYVSVGQQNAGTGKRDDDNAEQRLSHSLKLAQRAGVHTIVLTSEIPGYTPDVFVRMSTPQEIGTQQAQELVSKLALDKVTAAHPKSMEVLLPDEASKDSKDDGTTGEENATTSGDSFDAQAFAGIWSVLGPYFKDGRATSPSGLLTADTTADDWRPLTFDAQKISQVHDVLDERLQHTDEDTSKENSPAAIDGIIAMNDFVSAGVVEELDNLKYQGTSADVNPDISISGLVDKITGNRTLDRQQVPAPADGSSHTDDMQNRNNDTRSASGSNVWPIVTGFGAYVDMLPHIVDGKQWMTGMEDFYTLAHDVAQASRTLMDSDSVTAVHGTEKPSGKEARLSIIHEPLLAVSADNLKHELIEPGYISLADAGL